MSSDSPISIIPSWDVVSLKSVTLKIGSGSTPRGGTSSYLKDRSEYALVRSQNIFDNHFSHEGLAFISDSQAAGMEGVRLRRGDVLLNITGDGVTFARATIVPDEILPACVNQHVSIIRPNTEVLCNGYLLSYLVHPTVKSYMESFNSGGSRRAITKGAIESFLIPLPPLVEQKAIAHILGTLNDKIELNRKTNETLEAMARALFQSWFVDFDPVRAKAEGRPTGLPNAISDLFPGAFDDSELGEIPKGWEVQAVSDVVDSIFDGPHATPAESDTGNVFLGIRNMTGTKVELDEIRLIHDDDWGTWTRRVEPQSNDIVFTYEAALGLFGLIPPKLKCCLGRRMALIRPLPVNGYPHFWFHQFIAAPFQRVINERCIHGATVNRTPLTEFNSYPVLTPPSNIRVHFEELASKLWAKIHALSDQSRTLVPLRDTLLPKLISGELRIPDAKRMLEEAGV
jgi:type I restriction enzyme S subunit